MIQTNYQKYTKPGIASFLQIWQILESIGLFLGIPFVMLFGVMLNGDDGQYKTINFVMSNIIPVLLFLLVLKIIVTIFFFKAKRWTLYFNLFQNIILLLLQLIAISASIYSATINKSETGALITLILPGLLGLSLYLFLTHSYFRCLKHPYYLNNSSIKKN